MKMPNVDFSISIYGLNVSEKILILLKKNWESHIKNLKL